LRVGMNDSVFMNHVRIRLARRTDGRTNTFSMLARVVD
jgi:hypothetical protein